MRFNRREFLKLFGFSATAATIAGVTGCSKRTETVEHVKVRMNAPRSGNYDRLYFVQVDQERCQGCDTCNEYCPTGAIDGPVPGGPHSVMHQDLCVNCGQCLAHCPYGAIHEEVSFVNEIAAKLRDPDTVVVAMPAPAVRYAIGDPFGMEPGVHAGRKMFTALRRLGFKYVWDNEFAADLTILEEGTELIGRITRQVNKPLPQFTSCCPGWIKYAESFYPELLPNLSTCKSPIGMLGALAKTYGARVNNINPAKMYTVSIMPCIAKKYEGLRPEMNDSGYRDIDATINTRELAYMIKRAGLNLAELPESDADPALGISTGAATIFGATGGVMEAALRFAYEKVTGRQIPSVDFRSLRGYEGVREATVRLPNGPEVKVCVVSGLKNVKPIAEQVKAGNSPYHFIEVMTCPGGCINGGGQPLDPSLTSASWYNMAFNAMKRSITRMLSA
jgi:ferredoxin hydrogenase large subunit